MNMQTVVVRKSPSAPRGLLRLLNDAARPVARLVCLPWSGGSASAYRPLAQHFRLHTAVLAVQLPGREDRFNERPLQRMEAVVESVVGALLPLTDLPLFIFGHSMGALVAHQVAHALRAKTGRELDGLIVSGHAAPHRRRLPDHLWHRASDEDLIGLLRRLGGTSEEVLANLQMQPTLLSALRSDFEILETHAHQAAPPLACPLLACAGVADALVCSETMTSWRSCSIGAFQLQWFHGDHFYLLSHPAALARLLQDWMTIGTAGRPRHTGGEPGAGRRVPELPTHEAGRGN
jgi:pyochelin biosynthetic protein PchC